MGDDALQVLGLRSLLPKVIAATCPSLEAYSFQLDQLQAVDPADVQPIASCPSLRKLVVYSGEYGEGDDMSLDLDYHSPVDLKRQLPNVNSLHFTFSAVRPIVQAWDTQLTSFCAETSPDLSLL